MAISSDSLVETLRLLQFFPQPNLDQRLIRNVTFVRRVLDAFKHVRRQAQRDAVCTGLQIR